MDAVDGEDGLVEVGYAAMDDEHRAQVDLVRELAHAVEAGADQEALDAILDRLIETTNLHFLSEQLLMRQHNYPQYEAHTQEHDRLIEEVRAFRASAKRGERARGQQLVLVLARWLSDHMRGMDRGLGHYLKGQTAG